MKYLKSPLLATFVRENISRAINVSILSILSCIYFINFFSLLYSEICNEALFLSILLLSVDICRF